MKKTYDEFINSLNILSEDDFVELMTILPDVDIYFNDIDWSSYFIYINEFDDINTLAEAIIDKILKQWEMYIYCSNVNVCLRKFSLYDCESLDNLNEIAKTFKEWKISNFEELKKDFEKEEIDKIKSDKREEYDMLFDNLSPKEINEILVKYGDKK